MEAIEPNWLSALAFGAAWLLACAGFFYVSGSMPISAAPSSIRVGLGPVLVWLNALCVAILAIGAISFGHMELRLTSIIIVGGLVFLFSPFVVQELPSMLKDTQLGLLLLLATLLVAIAAFLASGAWHPIMAL